ncbi:class I SAM-dependent methyltransferase [Nitrospira japonica]|nr:class I SAM-dependent methyltransferase [Nitrospira japonica]
MNEQDESVDSALCRGCGERSLHTFIDLGLFPLCQTYIERHQLDNMEPFYPLHAYVCNRCFLVQLPEYVAPQNIFTEYAYFSSHSDSWLQHVRASADALTKRFNLGSTSQVIEAASNDGYFLQYFMEKGIPVIGVEPAVNVAQVAIGKGIPTVSKFFCVETARRLRDEGKQADLMLAVNVLDHVPDINDFVSGLKLLLKPNGVVVVEFPHLCKLIEGNQFDTIYHDRFSYLSFTAVEEIFLRQGLFPFDVEELPTHGGSLRIYACHRSAGVKPPTEQVARLRAKEEAWGVKTMDYYASFRKQVEDTKRNLLECLVRLKRERQTIVGYGVPAKGNVLLNYCGIRTDFLDYLVDRSPYKQGKHTPGTRIPIHSPETIRDSRPNYVLILPWNIKEEIMDQLAYIREWGGKFVVPVPTVQVYE